LIGVIGFKEIYEAWEQSYKDQIEYHDNEENNYASSPAMAKSSSSINPKLLTEQNNNAEKTDWLEQVPKVLCLQLNRIKYEGGE